MELEKCWVPPRILEDTHPSDARDSPTPVLIAYSDIPARSSSTAIRRVGFGGWSRWRSGVGCTLGLVIVVYVFSRKRQGALWAVRWPETDLTSIME
jgi:hypothetical protein